MHTLLEKMLLRSKSLEEVVLKIDLHDVSSLGTKISILVVRRDAATDVLTLDLIGEDLGVFDLLAHEVQIPVADSEIVNGDALHGGIIVEANLVCDIHTNWVSDNSFTAFNLNNLINTLFFSLLLFRSAEHVWFQV